MSATPIRLEPRSRGVTGGRAPAAPDRARSTREAQDERLLAIGLAGTAERRAAEAAEIERLARTVDYDRLAGALRRDRLLPLLGSRLVAAAPPSVPDEFREAVDGALAHARRRAALVEQVTLRLIRELDDVGIPVVPLKGPHLAERLHGDVGMRTSNDIDLLVQPADFHAAAEVLERTGYRSEQKAPRIGDLPLFEASLRSEDGWRPPLDLHWRLHWYEESFSRGFLLRSVPDRHGARAPLPVDEVAALLLFWCRDGLDGLRHAADVAAWWDRHGGELAPGALDEVGAAHPALRRALAAGALLAERASGVPADRLLGNLDRGERRTRLALSFANLAGSASDDQAHARTVVVDALLTPRGGGAAFVRRHILLPAAAIGEIYGLPARARLRRALRRAYYAASRSFRLARRTIGLIAAIRGGAAAPAGVDTERTDR